MGSGFCDYVGTIHILRKHSTKNMLTNVGGEGVQKPYKCAYVISEWSPTLYQICKVYILFTYISMLN